MTIDWEDLVRMQVTCLRRGINGVGIPDLLIAQNAIQNELPLLAAERHFALMSKYLPLSIHGE